VSEHDDSKGNGERDAAFVDAVMRRVATRPLPRRSWWRRLWAPREVTLRIRPASWALSVAALAVVAILVARPRHTTAPIVVESEAPVRVRFALAAPDARAVSLAGDFNGWRPETTPLVRGAGGVWMAEVPLGHGTFSYSFVVDGKWVEDPLADSWRADGFGGRNAVVRVGETAAAMLGPTRGG
jgi:hypothetical protein